MKCEFPRCKQQAVFDLKFRDKHLIYYCTKHAKKWEHEKNKALAEMEGKLDQEDQYWL